jgi:type I restriction enzyme S subunit
VGGFYRHVFKSRAFIGALDAIASGIRQGRTIPTDAFMDLEIPEPPLDEQRAIADYLDRQTARIDALIAAKRRITDLLAERRRTFISNAVMHGVGSPQSTKATGSPFAPAIPANWRLMDLKYVVRRIVDTAHKTAPDVENGDYLVVRTSNVKNGRLVLADARYTDAAGFAEWSERAVPEPGDILFTREAPAGEACLVPSGLRLCVGQRMVLIQVDDPIMLGDFGLYSIYGGAAQEYIELLSRSTTVAHLNMADILNIPVALPPHDEQIEIVEVIRAATEKMDALRSVLVRQIQTLTERRQGLITAAVTGELEIPGLAA